MSLFLFPTEEMTVDEFVAAFVNSTPTTTNWHVCHAVAGSSEDCESEEAIDDEFDAFKPLETSLIQLMKILKSSAKKFRGSLRESCISL